MKTIKYLNTIAIGTPIILASIGYFTNDLSGNYYGFALFSTILTGFIQLILGIILLFKFKENIHSKIYFIGVILFFSLWIWSPSIGKVDYFTYTLIYIPPILAIYLSVLIYKTPNKWTSTSSPISSISVSQALSLWKLEEFATTMETSSFRNWFPIMKICVIK